MRPLKRLFNRIILAFTGHRKGRPEDIPRRLPPEALAEVLKEARLLHGSHAVDVKSLEADEVPGLPRRADR